MHENVSFLKCDILDYQQVQQVFTQKPDIVFNLAGFANLDKAIDYPYETMELNILGNINLLKSSLEFGVKRFIYASSAYAMNNKGSFYGISKLSSKNCRRVSQVI